MASEYAYRIVWDDSGRASPPMAELAARAIVREDRRQGVRLHVERAPLGVWQPVDGPFGEIQERPKRSVA